MPSSNTFITEKPNIVISELPPLSLYVHFPWCVQKCPYCDFNSHAIQKKSNAKQSNTQLDSFEDKIIPEDQYINALLEDLEQELPSVWGRSITSIFIGGGTPSLLSVKAMDKLLSGIRARLPFLADTEVTMEANPGTVEADKFKGFFEAGVNRISIGVQSFNDEFLSTLGRIHQSDEAIRAFEIARNAGFKNINIDLMYALPNQSIEQALSDLKIAIDLKPEHLSWYQLTLEPNTAFHHSPPKNMADDDLLADISEAGLSFLAEKNYQRYEVSAFNLSGKYPSWHNTNYWQFGDYLGIGAGAHGKITRADTQQIIRTSKKRNPKDYLNPQKSYVDNQKILQTQELPIEFMLNAMRLKDGFEQSLFSKTTGLLNAHIQPVLNELEQKGLLDLSNNRIKPTAIGFNFLNDILMAFSPESFPKLSNQNRIEITELN